MYKLSKYIYESDNIDSIPEFKDKRFMFSTRSAISMLVGKDMIKQLRSNQINKLSENMKNKLIKYKFLVYSDADEFHEILNENKKEKIKQTALSITIQPTSNCQFCCHYCGQEHTPHMMTKNIEDLYIKRIKKRLDNRPDHYKSIFITWYGGEPLLAIKNIKSMTVKIKQLCKEYGLKYEADMITNGYNLQKNIFLDLLCNYDIKRFQVTIDGTAKTHDQRRVLRANHGATYDVIYNNVKDAILTTEYEEKLANIQIRINIDQTNYKQVNELLDNFIKDGIEQKVYLSFAPIEDWGGNNAGKASLAREKFADLQMKWEKRCIDNHIRTNPLLPNRNFYSCMVEIPDSEVYDALGNIYACWEFPYSLYKDGNNKICSVIDNIKSKNNNATLRDFADKIIKHQYPCTACILYPLCAGGCANAWHEGNTACPNYKYNLTKRLILDYTYRKNE